jgi:hypothetical protein
MPGVAGAAAGVGAAAAGVGAAAAEVAGAAGVAGAASCASADFALVDFVALGAASVSAAGSSVLAAAFFAGAFFGASSFGLASGNASRSFFATGGAIVEDPLFTNSPSSASFARATLESIPSSLAMSYTRGSATFSPVWGLPLDRAGR